MRAPQPIEAGAPGPGPHQRQQLAAAAASLHERLAWPDAPHAPVDAALAVRRLADWARALGDREGERMAWRLRLAGLTQAQALLRLGRPAPPAGADHWIDALQATWPCPGEPVALRAALVADARAWLHAHHHAGLLVAAAQQDLAGSLDTHLRHVIGASDGCRPRAIDFWLTRPAAARAAARLVTRWRQQADLLLARLAADHAAAAELLGMPLVPVARIEAGRSDPHAGGATVCVLHAPGGARLVYKPRDTAAESAWAGLLAWAAVHGVAVPPPPAQLQRAGYAWVAHVAHDTCDTAAEVSRYSRACGAVLCLAHLAGATDLHDGNVIATRAGPVLVDLETLLQPRLEPAVAAPQDGGRAAVARMQDSVLRTGLLPSMEADAQGHWADTGTLGHCFGALANADHTPEPGSQPLSAQLVAALHRGELPLEDIVRAIADGFAHAWQEVAAQRDALLSPGGALAPFRSLATRFLLRDTQLYLRLLRRSLQACDGVERSLAFEGLYRAALAPGADALAAVVAEEIAQLEELDVPLLRVPAQACSVAVHAPLRALPLFGESGWQALCRRVRGADPARLGEELALLRSSFAARAAGPGGPAPSPLPARCKGSGALAPTEVPREAGLALLRGMVRGDDGSVQWIAPVAAGRAWRLGAVPLDLRQGLAGVALFAAAHAVHGDDRFRAMAQDALAGLSRRLAQVGTADHGVPPSFWAELGWGVGQVAQLLHDAALHPLAHEAAGRARVPVPGLPWNPAAQDAAPVLHAWLATGHAARAHALATAWAGAALASPDAPAGWSAEACAAWAGALAGAHAHTPHPALADAAHALAAHSLRGAGPLGPAAELGWLHCAAHLPHPSLTQRLRTRLQEEAAAPLPALDGLAGGSCCLLDRLLTAAQVLDWPAARELAAAVARRVCERAGRFEALATLPVAIDHPGLPGLAMGHAGIGYTFLRLADPGLASWRLAP